MLYIVMNGKTQCVTETLNSNIQLKYNSIGLRSHRYFQLQNRPDPESIQSASCDSLPVMIGSHVQIVGNSNQGEGSFSASRVTVYTVNIRQAFGAWWQKQRGWESGALLEETPQVSNSPAQGCRNRMAGWISHGYYREHNVANRAKRYSDEVQTVWILGADIWVVLASTDGI